MSDQDLTHVIMLTLLHGGSSVQAGSYTLEQAQAKAARLLENEDTVQVGIVRMSDGIAVSLEDGPGKALYDQGAGELIVKLSGVRGLAEERLGGTAKGAPPTDMQRHRNKVITEAAIEFAAVVMAYAPSGYDQSLALTHIEDAKMRAVNAVFQNGASR